MNFLKGFYILQIIFITGIAIGVLYNFLQLVVTYFQTRPRTLFPKSTNQLSPVSILKPLKGLDDQLEENLHSFFRLEYPEYEIIMGFSDANDPGIPIARRMCELYPDRKTEIIVNHRRIGLNPKINNLANMYRFVSHDHILISDSNIRVDSGYLTNLMQYAQMENVGLVTSAIRGIRAKRLGALLENLHLNSFIISSVFTAHKIFRIPISIGKSMLMKKETLDKIGGFKNFKNVLAEDHLMSQAIKKLGLKRVVSSHFIDNINENWSVKRFLNRHTRWAKMRKTSNLFYYVSEALSNPIPIALLNLMIFNDLITLLILGVVLTIRIFIDGLIIRRVKADLRWYHLALIPLKDILIGLTWWVPFFSQKVNWRGNSFRIAKNTQLLPLTQGG